MIKIRRNIKSTVKKISIGSTTNTTSTGTKIRNTVIIIVRPSTITTMRKCTITIIRTGGNSVNR